MVLGDLYRGVVRGFKVCGVSGFSLGFGLELYRKLAQPDVCNAFAEENKRHYMSMYSSTYRLFIHIYIYVVCMYVCMHVCMYVIYIYIHIYIYVYIYSVYIFKPESPYISVPSLSDVGCEFDYSVGALVVRIGS